MSDREQNKPARYQLKSSSGTTFGSFNNYDRAVEYQEALLRLRGLPCELISEQAEDIALDRHE